MSENDTDASSDLGPMPEPTIEPGEPNPGGVDAIGESDGIEAQSGEITSRDLDPDDNPAVEKSLPDEVKQGEDTSTEATRGDGDALDDGDGDAADSSDEEAPA